MNSDDILMRDLRRLNALGFDPRRSTDPDLEFAWKVFESYQRAGEFDHLAQFVPADGVSIDVGANLGYYSIKLAALSQTVLSIEPVQELNWLNHALPANCKFMNCAAGEKEETITLHTPIIAGQPQLGMSSLIEKPIFGVFEFVHQTTPVFPLDKLAQDSFPDERISFIKLDVEGFERQVIQGANAILQRDHPNLQVEITPDEVESTRSFFETLGYQGCFFFNHEELKISLFEPSIHHALPECEDEFMDAPPANQPVDNFFFTPID